MKSVISIRDFSRKEIDSLIVLALEKKRSGTVKKLNKKVASLFFENSTRTRTSSETAAENEVCYVNGFAGPEGTSVMKGEPLVDTVRMFEGYGYDAIVMRHNLEGAARLACDTVSIPVINGGDGSNSHPTQTLLDLMTIVEAKGKIDGLKIALVGDLKYGRTVHTLLQAFELYKVEVWLVSPEMLAMPEWRIEDYKKAGKEVIFNDDLMQAISTVDVLYMTRIQRERFPEGPEGDFEYKKVSGIYNLNASMLKEAKKDLIILHPLPRYKHNLEIAIDVDKTPYARYIEQARNGMFMRQAIIERVFGKGFEERKKKNEEHNLLWQDLKIEHGKKMGQHMLYRLENGTLIDHIEAGKGESVIRVLGLGKYKETPMIYAKNLTSKRFGKKDVIGIKDKELSEEELSKLALVCSHATVNMIRDNSVFKKGNVILPYKLVELIECNNPGCITYKKHHEHAVSVFYVENQDPLRVRCHYCEKPMSR